MRLSVFLAVGVIWSSRLYRVGDGWPAGRAGYTRAMRVFGIDCGTEFTGYGVVEADATERTPRLRHLCAGAVRLN